eukprot:6729926-Prymnesium_polylepis.2
MGPDQAAGTIPRLRRPTKHAEEQEPAAPAEVFIPSPAMQRAAHISLFGAKYLLPAARQPPPSGSAAGAPRQEDAVDWDQLLHNQWNCRLLLTENPREPLNDAQIAHATQLVAQPNRSDIELAYMYPCTEARLLERLRTNGTSFLQVRCARLPRAVTRGDGTSSTFARRLCCEVSIATRWRSSTSADTSTGASSSSASQRALSTTLM